MLQKSTIKVCNNVLFLIRTSREIMDFQKQPDELTSCERSNDNNSNLLNRVHSKISSIPGIGLFLALVSGIGIATCSFLKEIMPHVHPSFLVPASACVQLAFFLPFVIKNKYPLFGVNGEKSALFQRGFFGYCAFICTYTALDFISLGDMSAIVFSAPVFVSIFGYFILKEPCGLFQVGTIIVVLSGVFLISRPSFLFGSLEEDVSSTRDRITGVIISFGGCLSMAYTFVSLRRLKNTPTPAVISFFSLFCILAGSLTMNLWSYLEGRLLGLPKGTEWILVLCHGMSGVLAQLCFVMALKLESAGLVSVIRTIDIVAAFFFQAVFLTQPIEWTSILGAVIICTTCVVVAGKRYMDSRKTSL